ncbi:MAG: hypothetical protein OEZ43_10995 [Gammaproteobacteria bacterium]|nr:hypothetical protein [Gammaproteobacteria bacterium]
MSGTKNKQQLVRHVSFALLSTSMAISAMSANAAPVYSEWSEPTNAGVNLNSSARDGCQFVTANGLSMYLASDRAGGFGGMDLYVARRANVNDDWQAPKLLGEGINSAYWEICPTLSPNEKVLFFTSERDGGCNDAEITDPSGTNSLRRDIYMSTRDDVNDDFGWSAPVHLGCSSNGGFNSAKVDQGPYYHETATGDNYVYFSSNRTGGKGGHDIYSVKLGSDQSPIVDTIQGIDAVNTSKNDHRPALSNNGLELYLDSNRRADLVGDHIYVATRLSTNHAFSEPTVVEAIANGSKDVNRRVSLANEDTELYYTTNRTGGSGKVDVWVSTRTSKKNGAN